MAFPLDQHLSINGQQIPLIFVEEFSKLAAVVPQLKLPIPKPTLVLVGGASKISNEDFERLRQLFVRGLAPLAQRLGLIVVDGGTDAGIMRLMGQVRQEIAGTFPLIGVTALDTIILPARSPLNPDAALPAPAHSHFVLVPGTQWGDESPWLAHLPTLLSTPLSSLTLVINGGEITWQDVSYSIQAQRPTFILAGSGRTADRIAEAIEGKESDPRAIPLVESGLLHLISLDQDWTVIIRQLEASLTSAS